MILEIVSPEATLFSGEITAVTLPGVNGSFQILNNHAPIVSTLGKGIIKIAAPKFSFAKDVADKFHRENEQTYTLSIASGTVELNNNKVIVLVD